MNLAIAKDALKYLTLLDLDYDKDFVDDVYRRTSIRHAISLLTDACSDPIPKEMKVTITGFNPFGIIETEEHDADKENPVVTGLMPLSIGVVSDPEENPRPINISIRFDYEDAPD